MPEKCRGKRYSRAAMSLFRPSFDVEPYTFRGDHLREIAFPLGGIGTGCVSVDGRGGLRDWEIFNRPNKNSFLEFTFPALWVRLEGEEATALAVHGPRLRNWVGEGSGFWNYGHGQFFKQMDGLPGFDEVEFCGTFPFARVRFKKKGFPLEVELCAFNPFIPLDNRSSSFPGACLVYRLRNTSSKPVDATLVWSMMNPVGETKPDPSGEADRCRNEYADEGHFRGIRFANDRFEAGDVNSGTAALTTNWPNVTNLPQWQSTGWWDAVQAFWNVFKATGRLEADVPQTQYRTPGSLGAMTALAPGEEVEIPFFISWVFPVATKYWGGENEPKGQPWKPWYATQWDTAWDAASEFFQRYPELVQRTRTFEEALFNTTLPSDVLQSVSATASILHTPTVIQLEDGTYWAWEGCSPSEGCCAGTCSHVWNYALTHAFLFPEMQRSMRRADYKFNFNCGPLGKEGAMGFRLMIPLGEESQLWHAASDGQLGGIVQLYRDWRLLGDDDYLRELWPSAKRALEFAWYQWDRDGDGLVDGDQHNTYDINFQGPNPLTQFFYLAALRAGEEISRHLGDAAAADRYRDLYDKGRKLTKERLWNGEYFVQENPYTEADAPKYQHGHGCLSDQIFGQLSATVAGLGDLVDNELIKGALGAIYKHNFKDPLGAHENMQRVFAVADEPGLILCSWPKGGRPHYPFVYSDEVWTGFEYQVASHLALEGMEKECLDIVGGIRKRYDGIRRNPWNEFECGSHYARALASYGVLLGLSGMKYDASDRTFEVGKEGRFFFSTPHGWGVVKKENGQTSFEVAEGRLFPE
jgi:non-lysosomal glucosylceramidase